MTTILLNLLAFGSVFSGILVITSRNPIISVLFLIAVFVNVACYFILLGINFIGLTYLIIYVGAIAILFLFVVIMINIKLAEITSQNDNNNIPLAIILSSLFLFIFYPVISINSISEIKFFIINLFDLFNFRLVGALSSKIEIYKEIHNEFNSLWEIKLNNFQQIENIGIMLYTSHFLWLIITSCILLLAMIGPIILCHKP